MNSPHLSFQLLLFTFSILTALFSLCSALFPFQVAELATGATASSVLRQHRNINHIPVCYFFPQPFCLGVLLVNQDFNIVLQLVA